MGYIQVGAPSASSSCKGAAFPRSISGGHTFAGGEGSTANQIVPELAVGEQLYRGGMVIVDGCLDALFTFTVWGGGDCKPCTQDTLTSQTYTKVIKPGIYEFDDFYWSGVTVQLVDAAGAPADLDVSLSEEITLDSDYTEDCPDCVKVVPA